MNRHFHKNIRRLISASVFIFFLLFLMGKLPSRFIDNFEQQLYDFRLRTDLINTHIIARTHMYVHVCVHNNEADIIFKSENHVVIRPDAIYTLLQPVWSLHCYSGTGRCDVTAKRYHGVWSFSIAIYSLLTFSISIFITSSTLGFLPRWPL